MPIRALPRHHAAARPLRHALVAGVVGGLLLVSGCGAGGDQSQDRPSGRPSTRSSTPASPTSSPTSSPTAHPSAATASAAATTTDTATGTATGTASSSPTPTSPGPLLAAGELPGYDAGYRWRPGTTSHREPATSFGTCQRFGLLAIGAERVAVRRFRPPTGSPTDRAGELLATFPDTATARRAYAVLTAWRDRCADRLSRYRQHRVGDLQDVPVDAGSAGWYLLTYGPEPAGSGRHVSDAQGTALVGRRIAMLTMARTTRGTGHPAGREPMAVAVGRAAAKLG